MLVLLVDRDCCLFGAGQVAEVPGSLPALGGESRCDHRYFLAVGVRCIVDKH